MSGKHVRMDRRRWELLAKHGEWEHWHAIYCPNDHLVRNIKTREAESTYGFWGYTLFHEKAFRIRRFQCPEGCPHTKVYKIVDKENE